MPTYEYRCKECSHEFEIVQSFSDDSLTECPSCGGPLRKVFGNVGIAFKGSGFYKNDSRSGGAKSSSSSESTSESKSGSDTKSSDSSGSDSSSSTSNDSGSKESSSSTSTGDKAKAAS